MGFVVHARLGVLRRVGVGGECLWIGFGLVRCGVGGRHCEMMMVAVEEVCLSDNCALGRDNKT